MRPALPTGTVRVPKQMARFERHGTGPESGTVESEMQQRRSQTPETSRRVEPIFDASGSLKRHAMSKIDEVRTNGIPETADGDGQSGR